MVKVDWQTELLKLSCTHFFLDLSNEEKLFPRVAGPFTTQVQVDSCIISIIDKHLLLLLTHSSILTEVIVRRCVGVVLKKAITAKPLIG